MSKAEKDITQLIAHCREGDDEAFATLFSAVYGSLRRIAQKRISAEFGAVTMNATALVNETYLKMVAGDRPPLADRAHLLAITAHAMRQVLVDCARRRNAAKRPQAADRIGLTNLEVGADAEVDVQALDAALGRLAEIEPRHAQIVELKFFGGLTLEEIAEALSSSTATVSRDWRMARSWLRRELEG